MARSRTSRFVIVAGVVIASSIVGACGADEAPPGAADTCGDGQRSGDEVGVDCGGACKKCTGDPCTGADDCKSAVCNAGQCAPPAGKTCGVGLGASCADGAACEQDADCASNTCQGAKCVPPGTSPAASNGVKDNGETDVDCGGANAPPCADGKACETSTDCKNAYCKAAEKTCATPTADDGVKNGTETDVDCGGQSGVKCGEGKECLADADCKAACNYAKKCVDAPSCKPRLGGDTCGTGEVGDANAQHESCCKTLEVKGFADPANAGKKVFLDKYEITAGRVRAFIEDISAKQGAKPNVKAWLGANPAPLWNAGWSPFLASDTEVDIIPLPNGGLGDGAPSPANVGQFYSFGSVLYVYVHGHNCYQGGANAYGFPTFWYPPDVMAKNGGHPRFFSQDQLDVKSMTCIPNAMLAAFCHWDGGQLATDEVLDFVTGSPLARPETTGGGQLAQPACGCTTAGCQNRCPLSSAINATSDSGSGNSANYYFPAVEAPMRNEGVQRISAPGRVIADRVRINPADEPWADLGGNLNEVAIDTTNGATQGRFTLKYRGIGFNSARNGGNRGNGNAANPIGTAPNPARFSLPEYKAAYSGGRCMRFR